MCTLIRYLAEVSHTVVPSKLLAALSTGHGLSDPADAPPTDALALSRGTGSLLAAQVAGPSEPYIDIDAVRSDDLDAAIALADQFGEWKGGVGWVGGGGG